MRLKERLQLRALSRWIRIPILAGPNRGLRWSLATRSSFLYGTYERERCQLIADLLGPEDVVYDIGAHQGYTALIAAKRTKAVVAFEPLPGNQWFIRHHILWNAINNLTLLPYAVSDRVGEASFLVLGTGTSHLTSEAKGSLSVGVRSVDCLVHQESLPAPTFLKVDAEGEELGVLRGAHGALISQPMRLLIATHSDKLHEQCRAFLTAQGYEVLEAGRTAQARKNGWKSVKIEPEILAFHPSVRPDQALLDLFVRS